MRVEDDVAARPANARVVKRMMVMWFRGFLGLGID